MPLNLNGNQWFAMLTLSLATLLNPQATLAQALTVTTLAGLAGSTGSADGTGSAARFLNPSGVATDSSGNVYAADYGNSSIRKITPAGVVTTLAGLARTSGSADGTGSAARFNSPGGVATDSSGNVYVADTFNHTIRKITPAGAVTTLAGLAGTEGSADGTGSAARFTRPLGVATDSSGNVYVADTNNNTIRKISPAGAVTTLAGLASIVGSADGTGSAARFNFPFGVATDTSGNVYVADTFNHTIRKITPAGAVTTLAGLAGTFGSADGTGSAARFNQPSGVATDSSENVYVADSQFHTIRKITPAGTVTTLAGLAGVLAGNADGTGSAARFNLPNGVATDSSGAVYVADTGNSTIRVGSLSGANTAPSITASGALSRVQGTASSALTVATASDGQDSSGSLSVTATSVPAGLTISTITNTNGTITATLAAACSATVGANTVTLQVTDSGGLTSTATVTVNVTANPAPLLGTYPTSTVSSGGSSTVGSSVAPTDNGSIASSTASATGFTGSLIVNPTSGTVSISNAGPIGNYTVMVAATDNCGLASSTSFALTVAAAGVAGDVNGDGRVSVADVFYLINFLFTGGPAPVGPSDVNADTRVSVADVFYLINFLFVGGPAPL